MCGIAGFCDFHRRSDEGVLARMTDALAHRGPDDRGVAVLEASHARVGLGHRRLSILDLSQQGHQPMFARGDRLAIVFNGEIYNFQEVRKELADEGVRFRSDGDTEVILEAFHRWGPDAVHRFIGMFAFALFDAEAEKLYLFRDRAGVKPVFYTFADRCLLFASELKALHAHPGYRPTLNGDALGLYLRYGFVAGPHSIFEGTHKLRPGHYLELDLRRERLREIEYWNVLDHYAKPKLDIGDDEAEARLEEILRSACNYRMVSDVPVGVFLSGGYDSTTVTALLQSDSATPLRTFTIGFPDERDEAPSARRIAAHLGTEHTEHYCTRQDALGIVERLPELFDEPLADSSVVPTTLVSALARQHVTVALSADGGDELFAGYSKYTRSMGLYRRLAAIPAGLRRPLAGILPSLLALPIVRDQANARRRAETIRELLAESGEGSLFRHKIEARYFTKPEVAAMLAIACGPIATSYDDFPRVAGNDPLNQMLAIDYQTYLVDDICAKVDRATMSVSLEGREPLLDHRIVEFSARLPADLKYRDGVQKYLLRRIVHKHVPPALLVGPKKGFGAPTGDWMRNELRPLVTRTLGAETLKRGGIFRPEPVVALRDAFLNGDDGQSERVWFLLCFGLWAERWL